MSPKDDVILIRIDPALKKRIREAAESRGQSITTFVTETCRQAAEKVSKKEEARMDTVFEGVPTFLRACCWEASHGGSQSYRWVGRTMAKSLGGLIPYSVDLEEWDETVQELRNHLDRDDNDGAWQWFTTHFPRVMKLIPKRRKAVFLQGVGDAHDDDGLHL